MKSDFVMGKFLFNSVVMRVMDIVISLLMIAITSPVFLCLIVAGTIKFGSPLFLQRRVGTNKSVFTLYNFRSLPLSTPSVPTHELNLSSISSYGRALRKSKLDELPQLVNVINGQMSLVGPRPCLPSQTELVRLREVSGVIVSKPGIAGLAQLHNIHMEHPEKVVELDRQMQSEMGVGFYLKILLATGFKLLSPKPKELK